MLFFSSTFESDLQSICEKLIMGITIVGSSDGELRSKRKRGKANEENYN